MYILLLAESAGRTMPSWGLKRKCSSQNNCLHVHLSVSVFVCLAVLCLAIHLSVWLFICLSVFLIVCMCPPVCLSVCLFVCLSVCMSIYLHVYLSIHLCRSVAHKSVCLSAYLLIACMSNCLFACLSRYGVVYILIPKS